MKFINERGFNQDLIVYSGIFCIKYVAEFYILEEKVYKETTPILIYDSMRQLVCNTNSNFISFRSGGIEFLHK